ncbi:hypothetical protein GCM10023325_11100 [Sphingomonas lutea]
MDVTLVAFVPGAGDCVVGDSGVASAGEVETWAKAAEPIAVDASNPITTKRDVRSVIPFPSVYVGIATERPRLVNMPSASGRTIVALPLR